MRKSFSAATGLLAVLFSSGCGALKRIEMEPIPQSVRKTPFPASPSQIPDTGIVRGGLKITLNPPAAPPLPGPVHH